MKEREIQKQIRDYINKAGGFCWMDRQGSTRPGKGTFHTSKGVADLLGIWKGKPLAIEVKVPGKDASEEQKLFLARHAQHGGISFVAHSVDEVREELLWTR